MIFKLNKLNWTDRISGTVVTNIDYKCENPCVIIDWIMINSVNLKYDIYAYNEYSLDEESDN